MLQFVAYWEQRTGQAPKELLFDSKLTTYANLKQLNQKNIQFITLRRRSQKMLMVLTRTSASAWRRVDRRRPGHEEPTVLRTKQMRRAPATLIERYAQRRVIANSIADGIDFFHIDALSSAVAMKITCDVQLTLMASSLYRLLGAQIGRGYEKAKGRHIFRDFIDAVGLITLTGTEVIVRYQKRAHNPLLIARGVTSPRWGEARSPSTLPWTTTREVLLKKSPQATSGANLLRSC